MVEHGRDEASSIIGGYVYRGPSIPCLRGQYLYTDYVSSKFFSFRYVNGKAESKRDITSELNPGASITSIVSMGEDGAGELYVVTITGRIYKVQAK